MRVSRTLVGIVFAGIVVPLQASAEDPARPGGELPAETPAEYDPFAGIDPDGRIPNVARPSDMTHPERWRYIPEGRIVDGNFFDRFLVSSFVVPVFFFEGDVGAGGGVAITDLDFGDSPLSIRAT